MQVKINFWTSDTGKIEMNEHLVLFAVGNENIFWVNN